MVNSGIRNAMSKKGQLSVILILLVIIASAIGFFIYQGVQKEDCYPGKYDSEEGLCIFDIDEMMASENVHVLSGGEFVECPENSVFNEDSKLCEMPISSLICEKGDYSNENDVCEYYPNSSLICEKGDYNSESEKCEYSPSVYAICSEGDYSSENDVCEISPEIIYECEGELREVDGAMSCVIGLDILEDGCGDGMCSRVERIYGVCSEDCMEIGFCGDGVCEDLELTLCETDCGVFDVASFCGDGVCGEEEMANLSLCPEDCEIVDDIGGSSGSDDTVELDALDYTYSPFGILTGFYPPMRIEGEKRPTEYQWNISDNDDPYFSTINDLGLIFDRGTHPILDWSFVQSSAEMIQAGEYDWSVSDNYIEKIPEDVNFVLTLNAGNLGIALGQWEFRNDLFKAEYINFVEKAVERYNGDGVDDMPGLNTKVKYWQIENEPVTYIDFNVQSVVPNYDYAGYSTLLETAYTAIKGVDSEAKVLSAGVVSVNDEAKSLEIYASFWSPLIVDLNGNYVDIFDFHWFGDWETIGDKYVLMRTLLDDNGFSGTYIWMTENGASSETGEVYQAEDLVKRLFYPLALGVEKTFWAWGLVEGWPPFDCSSQFDYTGLIYDGYCEGDLGYGVKKLAYYSFKFLNEKLIWLDLTNIETISNFDGIFVYKLYSRQTGEPTWILWNENSGDETVSLDVGNLNSIEITQAVARYSTGQQVVDYEDAFESIEMNTGNGLVSISLGETPIFVE